MKQFVMISIAVTAFLVGCGAEQGYAYLGKRANVRDARRTLEIERDGDSFMVRNGEPNFIDGKMATKNIPATLKDGVLQASVGFSPVTLAIDKSSGNLMNEQAEYKRVNRPWAAVLLRRRDPW